MDPAWWRRAEPLLDDLLEMDPSARADRLDALARTDPDLHAAVAAWLKAAETEDVLGRSAGDLASALFAGDDVVPTRSGERVGPFRILGELGRGGMGAVYAAERVEGGFDQQVAVKVLKRGLDSEHVLRRFEAERRILARLEHPHIARLIDGGLTEDGLPWFALERVDGRPITADADARALEVPARLRLFLDVCGAVGFAHEQRIVHRDIKPSNVLVDTRGQVKLLDFGIAKLLDPADERLTRTSARVLTPRYAAPEQVSGGPITVATDVWQLGRLLAELSPGSRTKDLQRIVEHARHEEPGRRYASVAALGDDVRRFLEGRPVLARGDSPVYRLTRLVRRHRATAAVASIALLAIMASLILLAREGWRSEAPAAASGFTLLTTGAASQRQPTLSPDGDALAFVADANDGVAQIWTRRLGGSDPVPLTSGTVPAASPRWSREGRIVFERRGQGIWSVSAGGGTPVQLVEQGSNPNLSRDGRWLVYERRGAGVWIGRSDGSGARRIGAIPESLYVNWADRHPALSPDGTQVVYFLAVAGPWGDFWRVAVNGGTPERLTFDLAEGGTPAWLPDGRSVIVSSARDGARTLWRIPLDGARARPLTVGGGDDLWPDVSADGRRLVYTSARTAHVVRLRDPRSGRDQDVLARRMPIFNRPMVSPAGDRIAFFSGPRAGTVRVFTVRVDGSELRQVTAGDSVDQVTPQWSPDGETLYFSEDYPQAWVVMPDGSIRHDPGKDPDGRRRTLRAIPAAGGADREVLRDWVTEREMYTQIDPAGRRAVYTRAVDGSPMATLIRDLATGAERILPRMLLLPRWSPDGIRLVGVTREGRAVNCPADGTDCVELGRARSADWSGDGLRILLRREAAPLDDPQLLAVDVVDVPARGGPERSIAHLAPLRRSCAGISVAPDGRIAWVAYDQGRQELWSARLSGGPLP